MLRWTALRGLALSILAIGAMACHLFETSPPGRLQRVDELYRDIEHDLGNIPSVTALDIGKAVSTAGIVLVDVRTETERQVSILPGAITQAEFDQDMRKHAGKTIVAYCTIGYRSGVYVQALRARGIPAFNLKGGVLAWAHAGYPFISGSGPTQRVHVYGAKWDLLPPGYEATR